MALDLGLTTHQPLSAMDGVADAVRDHDDQTTETLEHVQSIPADEVTFRTAAVGRRPHTSARTDTRCCRLRWAATNALMNGLADQQRRRPP